MKYYLEKKDTFEEITQEEYNVILDYIFNNDLTGFWFDDDNWHLVKITHKMIYKKSGVKKLIKFKYPFTLYAIAN